MDDELRGFEMHANPELIKSFGQFLKTKGKKDATIRSYCLDLTQFMNFLNAHNLPLSSVDYQIIVQYKSVVQEKNFGGKSNSFRRAVIAIKQFYKFLPQFSGLTLGSIDTVPIPSREEDKPPKLQQQQIDTLLQFTHKGEMKLKEARDRAIISLLCFEGIKVSELIELEWSHFLISEGQGTLLIPGERRRMILLNASTFHYLCEYKKTIEEYEDLLPKKHRMFLGFKGRESFLISPQVSRHGLKFMLYELGNSCRIHHLNTEMLRHFAIQFHLDHGSNPEEIMKHFGLRRIGNIAKHFKVKNHYGNELKNG